LFIKKQRLNWLGHVERMAEDNIVQKVKRWKPMSKDQLEDLKHVGSVTFGGYKKRKHRQLKKVAQNRDSWKKVVEEATAVYRL